MVKGPDGKSIHSQISHPRCRNWHVFVRRLLAGSGRKKSAKYFGDKYKKKYQEKQKTEIIS